MTDLEKMKYLRSSILAAVGAAAVGAVARGRKAKKDREKAMDVASSSNAIVVPISKKKFLEGLKTPEEQRSEFEGKRKIESDEKQLLAAPTTDLPAPVDVASMKKDILKRRKFDFFGKRASVKAAQPDEKNDGESGGDKKTEVVSEEKIDGRVVLRGQDGKFVSPTDPVAVQDVEKSAGIIDDFKRGLKEHPVALTAGAIGSVMLAAKISDMINERRREKAKSRLDDARSRYVSLLEGGDGNEKVANDKSDSLSNLGGRVVGTAFLVPLALTAMVTNKIIENRKAEKKRQKEMSDSYPQDPTILYRTYDGDTLKIAADTALMAIMVKRAMIDDAERAEIGLMKRAQVTRGGGMWIDSTNGTGNVGDDVEFAVKNMTDPRNRKNLLRFIKAQQAGDEREMESAYRDMMPFGTALGNHYNIAKTPEFKRELASNKALQDAVVGNLENDKDWKAYRDSQISDRIAGWGLDRGGILHKIIMWLANAFGFGNSMARKYVLSGFGSARDRYQSQIDKMEQEARKNHFAPLENFKGTQQERDKLENDLKDSWMVKQVDSINDPESFAMAARNLANLDPRSPQYKTLYDALSKKKDINPAAFSALAQPSNIASQSQSAPSTAAPNASTTSPAAGAGQASGQSVAAAEGQTAQSAEPSPAAPYQGDPARGPVSSSAGLDPQQYQGSEAPDYAEQEMPTVKGLEERIPSYNDASWRTLSNIAAAPSNQHPQGLADPELNELLKLETGRRLNPVERPHDNQSWDTVGIGTKLKETPPRPSSASPARPPSIVPPRPIPSDEEQMSIIDDAIKNPIHPVVGAPQQPPVGQSAFESNARFRPSATKWTDYVGSNPGHLYNYPVGDYTKSDLGQ